MTDEDQDQNEQRSLEPVERFRRLYSERPMTFGGGVMLVSMVVLVLGLLLTGDLGAISMPTTGGMDW